MVIIDVDDSNSSYCDQNDSDKQKSDENLPVPEVFESYAD